MPPSTEPQENHEETSHEPIFILMDILSNYSFVVLSLFFSVLQKCLGPEGQGKKDLRGSLRLEELKKSWKLNPIWDPGTGIGFE